MYIILKNFDKKYEKYVLLFIYLFFIITEISKNKRILINEKKNKRSNDILNRFYFQSLLFSDRFFLPSQKLNLILI